MAKVQAMSISDADNFGADAARIPHLTPGVLFLCLDAFSRVGGLQAFNRRITTNLSTLGRELGSIRPRSHLMGDDPDHLPAALLDDTVAYKRSRVAFIRGVIREGKAARLVLLGHINLLPVGCALKLINPRIKVALFVHGDEVWNGHARRRKFYEPLLVRSLDRIASVSRYTATVMAREFRVPMERFVIFPNAVDLTAEDFATTRQPDLLLTVSRLGSADGRKNIDELIRAVAILKSRGSSVRLEVVGDGVLRPQLQELAEHLGVGDRVRFLGRLSDQELGRAYSRATAFVLPSSKEGFGIVFLEAWLRGLPVICGKLGASHEIVDDGIDGFVCDETNPADLAGRIFDILSDPARASMMGVRGMKKTHAQYLNANAKDNLGKLLRSFGLA